MYEPTTLMAKAGFALAGLGLFLFAALRGWQGWLELRQLELGSRRSAPGVRAPARLELTELRDRVRRLEAIANGTEA